ncbi:IS982 family transposase [Candidatus Poribacteria bacterium]|nr:IS982 family transposase [Candidatus Poribacteria bacterium]
MHCFCSILMLSYKSSNKGGTRMDLQYTLERFALQLKNQRRTFNRVARVFQKIMKTLYEHHFPNAEAHRPGPNPNCRDADILTVAWLLEYIGEDSENSGYRRLKAELKTVFPNLPERSRFNRRRRNLASASEVLRRTLTPDLSKTDVFIVDSFPMPVCDFKRAKTSKSDLKWADGTGTYATYGHCETKGLGTFFSFRCSLITTGLGVPVDFCLTAANRDDRAVLPHLAERGEYPILLGDKGYISEALQVELMETEGTVLLPTLKRNQKHQYPDDFRPLQVRIRRRIETTIGQLTEQFHIARVRALKHWGVRTRMSNKMGSCVLGAFVNQCLGRPLMKLKDLVLA